MMVGRMMIIQMMIVMMAIEIHRARDTAITCWTFDNASNPYIMMVSWDRSETSPNAARKIWTLTVNIRNVTSEAKR
jgi:hypothetical protein